LPPPSQSSIDKQVVKQGIASIVSSNDPNVDFQLRAADAKSEMTKLNMIRCGGTLARKPKSSKGDVSAESDFKKSGIVF